MTQRYRKFKRSWGSYYAYDNATGNSVTLKTRDKREADRKVQAMNETERQSLLFGIRDQGAAAGEDARATVTGKDACATKTTECIGVESILMHESGEFIAERIVIALTEEKGKSRVQSAGSTLTYLRRYSWAAILGMYSDEDSDGSSPIQAFTAKPTPTLPPPPQRREMKKAE